LKRWINKIQKAFCCDNRNIYPQGEIRMKIKFSSLLIFSFFLLSCTSAYVKQAKIYQNDLQLMMGKDSKEIISKLETSWSFKLSLIWKATDPNPDDALKNTKWEAVFSKKEAEQIFSPTGQYEVMLYSKFLTKDVATTQEITPMGTSGSQTIEHAADRYAYIRLVFRDKKLVEFKVIPKK